MIDFGTSHYGAGKGEQGTYGYMAPEVTNNETFDSKSDMWSVGIMLLEWVNFLVMFSPLLVVWNTMGQ